MPRSPDAFPDSPNSFFIVWPRYWLYLEEAFRLTCGVRVVRYERLRCRARCTLLTSSQLSEVDSLDTFDNSEITEIRQENVRR